MTNVTLNGVVQPTNFTVHNSTKTYSITSSSGNNIAGSTGLTKSGNGTLTLSGGANTYTGATTIGGTGMLVGHVTLNAGTTLAPGASAGSVGTLTFNSDLIIGGDLAIEVNKSLSPSNDLVVVNGPLGKNGTGTVSVTNLGPALAVGDKFTLFSKPMQNGAALTITGAGATWANNLAVDGSISIVSVSRPMLNFTLSGGNGLQFSWDTGFGNFKLQSQTNSLNSGLGTNWADYPGGGTSPVTVPIGLTNATVFFRLVSTP
jgi:fibronectin-binding autotransporter adhesin